MTRTELHDLIDYIDEKDVETIYNVLVKFVCSESHTPNEETIAAIEEMEEDLKHPEKLKIYNSFSEILAEVEEEMKNEI